MAIDIFSYILGSQINGGGSGKGSNFKSLTLEEDGSYTVVDFKDVEHTIEVEEENGTIVGLTYDGEEINIEYDEDGNLMLIGESEINVSNHPSSGNKGNGSIQFPFYDILNIIIQENEVIIQ